MSTKESELAKMTREQAAALLERHSRCVGWSCKHKLSELTTAKKIAVKAINSMTGV